jgi:pyruvate/2-oxoglutarate/acetoin dehydrogenase E1 component
MLFVRLSSTPLDVDTILTSVRTADRLVVMHEATRTGGFAGEIVAIVMERAFADLKARDRRSPICDRPAGVEAGAGSP